MSGFSAGLSRSSPMKTPQRPQIRGILKKKSTKDAPKVKKIGPNAGIQETSSVKAGDIKGLEDVRSFLKGLRGDLAAMGVPLDDVVMQSQGGGVGEAEPADASPTDAAHVAEIVKTEADTKDRAAGGAGKVQASKKSASLFKSESEGLKGKGKKEKEKSVFKTGDIMERPMPLDGKSVSLPLSGEGDKIEGFELDFDVVAESEWKKGGKGDSGANDDDNDWEGEDKDENLNLEGCSLAESIMTEEGRIGPKIEIPGDMGWLGEEGDEGDDGDDGDMFDFGNSDYEEEEEEESEEGKQNRLEEQRERGIFLEAYGLMQNLLTSDTKRYSQHLEDGGGEWKGKDYSDVELQRREGLRLRVGKAINGTILDDAELKRRWIDLTNTFDFSVGAPKAGEEGFKVFTLILGKVMFKRGAAGIGDSIPL
eukprot:CAMPEP_0118642024 /NCGR_PEP_ID=MMETSP0785-20121206/5619_1 /TAXON_ID=91992 /ORGANISM="Bolidomonas pacifica, Strain CCMP 1866" /LENGTH=421 /DNA_ID=CAMNT_0006533557 /DNA_START=46 /DNA_END=1308 /DNA_ORIENTATION=+